MNREIPHDIVELRQRLLEAFASLGADRRRALQVKEITIRQIKRKPKETAALSTNQLREIKNVKHLITP